MPSAPAPAEVTADLDLTTRTAQSAAEFEAASAVAAERAGKSAAEFEAASAETAERAGKSAAEFEVASAEAAEKARLRSLAEGLGAEPPSSTGKG